MKFLTLLSIILLLTFSSLFSGIDVQEIKEKLALIQNTGNSGRDFWFTIPPVYESESGNQDNTIEILVTSVINTEVTVSVPKGYTKTKSTIPNGVISFQLTPNQAQPILYDGMQEKILKAKVYKGAAIHVVSDFPIIVYVAVKFKSNSDGFFAIPTKYFGTKYINAAYKEPALSSKGLFTPFTGVVAAYDNTNVNFTMGGGDEGDDAVPFDDGSLIETGESKSTNMSRGDVLLLSINGQRQDLSGSLFVGDKPFAIVSGMHCANIPVGNRSCDYAVNMEFPIKNWGKTHMVTPQMDRAYNGVVRIYASEPNTSVYRDGSFIGTIKLGGGSSMNLAYFETRIWPQKDDLGERIPPKPTTFTSNKPTQIIYYNTGSEEDKDYNKDLYSDPYMAQVPPIESAVTNAVVSSPNALGGKLPFTENYLKITFPLVNNKIPDDLLFADLSTSNIKPKYTRLSEVFSTTFDTFAITYEGKKYASKKLNLPTAGVYSFKSDSSRFKVESFGAGSYENYGFPSAFNLRDLNSEDDIAPIISYIQQCEGDVLMEDGLVTDLPNDIEKRSNLADVFMLAGDNYKFEVNKSGPDFILGKNATSNWALKVIDKSKPASAIIYAVDMVGNDTTILINYVNPEIEATSTIISLQNPNIKEITFQDTIRNTSKNSPLYLSRIEFGNKNSVFKIESYEPKGWDMSMPILPNSEIYLNVKFAKENIDNTDIYSDSLFIGLGIDRDGQIEECTYYAIANYRVYAQYPMYVLESSNDFGELNVESKPIKLQETIRNLSESAPLYISRLDFKSGNKGFSFGGFLPSNWDITKPIAPKTSVVVEIIFNPKSVEQGEKDIELIDSLGIGIGALNEFDDLEELEFSYKTQQKAILIGTGITSVTPEQTLAEYMTVTESSIQILPLALADGFSELSVFNLEGVKVISAGIQSQNSVAISNLKSGTYIITLKSESRLLTRKINVVK